MALIGEEMERETRKKAILALGLIFILHLPSALLMYAFISIVPLQPQELVKSV